MNLVQRVQDVLLKPQSTWPVIAQESGDATKLFKTYVMPLAAIPAVAGFVGMSLLGFGGGLRVPIVTGLVHGVVGYVLSLAMVLVFAWIVDALAPSFGAVRNPWRALKVVAYSLTASWVGGVFLLVPVLASLKLVASLYSLYLLYLGLSALMEAPKDRVVPYTAVTVIAGIVVAMGVGAISALALPSRTGLVGVGGL